MQLYSIIADPREPTLWTNRAMARLKLSHWPAVVDDCIAALALAPSSMKGHYYLSQAQLALRDYDAALASALSAHAICAETNDKSLPAVTGMVLKAKKERWEEKERRRKREDGELEEEVLEGLRKGMEDTMDEVEGEVARKEVVEEWEAKIQKMQAIFDRSRSDGDKRREVPDWAIDDISFGIMVDPVVVRSSSFSPSKPCRPPASSENKCQLTCEPTSD
jgi:STIP1 homology and U-box containing protein 1